MLRKTINAKASPLVIQTIAEHLIASELNIIPPIELPNRAWKFVEFPERGGPA